MNVRKFTHFSLILVPGILLLVSFILPHPVHVSLTEIRMNLSQKRLEISCRMFTDDLETIIRKNYLDHSDLHRDTTKPSVQKYLSLYVHDHLEIKVDGVLQKFDFIGYEIEEDATWCYFEKENFTAGKRVDISNSLLYDLFDDQVNMIHCYRNDERKSMKLNYPEKISQFDF